MLKRTTAVVGCLIAGAIGFFGVRTKASPAETYSFFTLDVPNSSLTAANGVDVLGRIVGYYEDGAGTHGFLFSKGEFSPVDYPGGQWTAAYGINSQGQIVGAYGPDAVSGRHGFLLSNGRFSSIDVPGSTDTVARGVSSQGQIVGDYAGSDGARHGFFPALLALAGVLSNLESASTSLVRAQNQSPCVKESVLKIGAAVSTVRDVIAFIDATGGNGAAAARLASAGPDFSQPPKRFSSSNTSLYNALESLRVAFNKLDQTPGGDWGGLRAKLNAAIGAAAVTLRPCIIDGNRIFEEQRAGRRGDPMPANSTSETKRNVETALSNLESAAAALRRAQNQSECVKASVSKIDVAVSSMKDVIRAVDANVGNGPAAGSPAGDSPDFTPPPKRNANSNTNLYSALASLRAAFEKLAQVAGGDWGSLRGKLNADIGAAVATLRPCIVEGNRIFEERRGGGGRGELAPSASATEPKVP